MHIRLRKVFGAVLFAGALVIGSIASAQATPLAPPPSAASAEQNIQVSATGGWQASVYVPAGESVTIQAPSVGQYWTVDDRPEANLPFVAAQGYPGEPVWGGNPACKIDPTLPYGALLFRLGDKHGIAAGSIQRTSSNGDDLMFSINDLERCQWDNAGSLPVAVSIG